MSKDSASIVERLREGSVQRRRRWSGDTHTDLGGSTDEEATDALMAEAAAEIERLTKDADNWHDEATHYLRLAVDDPGKNPPVFWKTIAEEARAKAIEDCALVVDAVRAAFVAAAAEIVLSGIPHEIMPDAVVDNLERIAKSIRDLGDTA